MYRAANFEKTQKPAKMDTDKRPDSKRGKDSAKLAHQQARRKKAQTRWA